MRTPTYLVLLQNGQRHLLPAKVGSHHQAQPGLVSALHNSTCVARHAPGAAK